MEKEDILAEIRRTTKENGGKPLGWRRFAQVTGIKPYDWGGYWARFGDVQLEAGFEPNRLNPSFSEDYLLESLANLTRELQKFPTQGEMRLKRSKDPDFPDPTVFRRFGGKSQFIIKVLTYCQGKSEYADVVKLLEPIAEANSSINIEPSESSNEKPRYGFVYLVKGHPGEYKIGHTNLVDRRLSELGVTASIEQELIHEIKTDDPSGIEAYWHGRFKEKRMRGEWFKLNAADVRAFKRWRLIY